MTIRKDPLNIIITGVGGQGNVLASHIIATAGIKEGFYVTVGETYGASQRGGGVMSNVRFSSKEQYSPLISSGQADIIIGLEPAETLRVISDFGNPNTRVLVSPRPVYPIWVLSGMAVYPPVEEIVERIGKLVSKVDIIKAGKEGDSARAANVLMVGALAGSKMVPIAVESYEEAIREIVPPNLLEMNMKAFKEGVLAMA